MRRNYFVGGIVSAAVSAISRSGSKKATGGGGSFVDPRAQRAEYLDVLDKPARESTKKLEEIRQKNIYNAFIQNIWDQYTQGKEGSQEELNYFLNR